MGKAVKRLMLISLILMNTIIAQSHDRVAAEKRTKDFRAVWLHQTKFDQDEATARKQIVALFDSYAETGINNLFCYYTLQEENHLAWDYLQVIIEEGHKRGIGIHPVFCPGHDLNHEQAMKEHADWLIRDIDGKIYPNYNLALPAVRKFWIGKIAEAMKYDIDGIHLDYARFPVNQRFSYDSITCALFREEWGRSPLDDSHDSGSMLWCEWIRWNEKQITAFVREAYEFIKKTNRKLVLGADVFPNVDISPVEIGQNWGEWVRQGIIDFVCPMLYTNDTDLFREYITRAVQNADSGCEVYAGIGIVTSHNKITKEILEEEIEIARKAGTRGVVFFSGFSLNEEFLNSLKPAFRTNLGK